MSIITGQRLARYLEQYRTSEVTFNKEVIVATGLVTRNVYLKILDHHWPCVVFSSSMAGAKVISDVKAAFFSSLRQTNGKLALRWCFKLPDKVEPITFFVACHATGFTPYNAQEPDVQIITLEYTQQPPDDLIEIIGSLMETHSNAKRRKDERIIVSPDTLKKLGLETREAWLTADGVEHRCILRDISFGGAKVLASSIEQTLTGKAIALRIAREEPAGALALTGLIRRVEELGGRKDILAVCIEYSPDPPMTYKLLINNYLSAMRKPSREAGKEDALPAGAEGPRPPAAPGAGGSEPPDGDAGTRHG